MEVESSFLWVGGHTCLDFVNTEAMRQGDRTDLIPDGVHLLNWMNETHLLSDAEKRRFLTEWSAHPEWQQETMSDVRDLRAIVRAMMEQIAAGQSVTAETLSAINSHLEHRVGYHCLQRTPDGTFVEQFMEQTTEILPCLAGRLAETVSDFLCHADLSLVRRCENPRCILYFYDTTKNHKRRWCSMSGCGNRAKAAAHYRRTKQGQSGEREHDYDR